MVLAYTRTKVIFETFDSIQTFIEQLEDYELLELHIFDNNKEYRCIATESHLPEYQNGYIEYIADFDANDAEHIYKEIVELEKEGQCITVLNHIEYNEENGMAVVDDYRLVMGGN